MRDGKLLARQEPCISYINAVLQTLSREEKPKSWVTWIDKEIDSKGIHATVHFPLPLGEKGRRLMPRELSTALWLLRYGISTEESFSTLYGLFANNSYPKSYDQKLFDQDYLTSDFVNKFIIYPIGQIVSIVCGAAGDEKTKDLLTEHFVNKPKYTTLIGLFRDAVRTTLATSFLSAVRQFGPDPLSKVVRVKNSLEVYAKKVTFEYKSSHRIKQHATKTQNVMGVLEAIVVSLPGYIEKVYHDNVKQMFPRLKMSKSESWGPETKLSDFELFIPMTDNITGVKSFDTLDTYFKSILSGTIDPPAYEHVKISTETEEKPDKKPRANKAGASPSNKSPKSQQKKEAPTQKRKSTNEDENVAKKSKSKKQEDKEEMSLSSTSSQLSVKSTSSSSEEDITSEKSGKNEKNKPDSRVATARLMKMTIEKIKKQHGELMKQVEDWDMPDDIMKPIMAIDKILKNNK